MLKYLLQYFERIILKDELATDYKDVTSSLLHFEVVD